MFNSIRGIITEKRDDLVYIETGGLEWEISVPLRDSQRLPPVGNEGRVYTYLLHREDQMRLFGFESELNRRVFLELLSVDGIGPKGALKILGGISREELEKALDQEDLGRLQAVPGLGKKTAQKMILALKGKLARDSGAGGPRERSGPYADLVEALAGMGYDRRMAEEALIKADALLPAEKNGAEREKQLFREAIIALSGA